MNIFAAICEAFGLIITAIGEFLVAFLKLLPIYDQLSGLKEEIIATAIGVPTIVITLALAIPGIIKLACKIANRFL